MKRVVIALGLILLAISAISQTQDITVQSMHTEGATYAVLDNSRNLLISYAYKDETLKFWNKDSGFLYHTEDLKGYCNDLEVNTIDGKTYALINNTVVVYDNASYAWVAVSIFFAVFCVNYYLIGRYEQILKRK